MNFRVLRVINEDFISPGAGFPTHGHRDMEIITYVIDGALEHKDSMGNGTIIRPGEVQRMSAGTGVRHSEYNSLKDAKTHLLQIWILPDKEGVEPSYEQKSFTEELSRGDLVLVASKLGENGSVRLHQDIKMYAARVRAGFRKQMEISSERHMWLQIVRGEIAVDGETLKGGDGIAVSEVSAVGLKASEDSEFLTFDLP